MTVNAGALQAAAVAIATELTIGDADWQIIDAITEPLPDDAAPALIALILTYGDHYRHGGAPALRRAGLHAARLQLPDAT